MLALAMVVLCVGVVIPSAKAEVKVQSPSRQKRSVSDEATSTCTEDYLATSVCVACADLPPGMELPLDACCSSKFVQMMCAACLLDLETCAKETLDFKLDELDTGNAEDEELPLSKRYGRLFMGTGRPYNYRGRDDKRYGKLFMGDSPYYRALKSYFPSAEKRFGTLFMGSSPRIGYGRSGESERDKRYGTLFMRKRYGRLFLGNGYGRAMDEKRANDDLPIHLNNDDRRKRYGSLFLSSPRLPKSRDKKSTQE